MSSMITYTHVRAAGIVGSAAIAGGAMGGYASGDVKSGFSPGDVGGGGLFTAIGAIAGGAATTRKLGAVAGAALVASAILGANIPADKNENS